MPSNHWTLVGQIGDVRKSGNVWIVDIADNKYSKKNGKSVKNSTIWFNCICKFEPNCKKGDKVLAEGTFVHCHSGQFPFTMEIKHIGPLN